MTNPREEKLLSLIKTLQTDTHCTLSTSDFPDDTVSTETQDAFYKTLREGKTELTLQVTQTPSTAISKQLETVQIRNVDVTFDGNADGDMTTAFVNALSANKSIQRTSLNVDFYSVTSDDWANIAAIPNLLKLPSLKHVVATGLSPRFGFKAFDSVLDTILKNPTVESIEIMECSPQYELTPSTKADSPPMKSSLKKLELIDCNLSADDLQKIVNQTIQNQSPITHMKLYCRYAGEGYQAVAKHISSAPWVWISMRDDDLSNYTVYSLITALKTRTAPCFLEISSGYKKLTEDLLLHAIHLVRSNPAILDLYIGLNDCSDKKQLDELKAITMQNCLRFVHDYVGDSLPESKDTKNYVAETKSYVEHMTKLGTGLFTSLNQSIPPDLTRMMIDYTQSIDKNTLNEIAHDALDRYFKYHLFEILKTHTYLENAIPETSKMIKDNNLAEFLTKVQNEISRVGPRHATYAGLHQYEVLLQKTLDLERRINLQQPQTRVMLQSKISGRT